MQTKNSNFEMIPREGDIVYGRVNKVEDRFVRVDILAIEERPLPGKTRFSGIIFKENVRDYDRDGI
jgi:exosome complex RNA-binding protein Csl4